MFISTKTYGHERGLSCAFRQHRAESHCARLHGYALSFRIEFGAHTLNEKNWVVDFGGLNTLKDQLTNLFDHTTAVAKDDPNYSAFNELNKMGIIDMRLFDKVGCEAFAKVVFDLAVTWLNNNNYSPRVEVLSVECSEHGANSAIYKPSIRNI